jgi:hypothetical protein
MIGKESLQLVKRSRLAFCRWHPGARRAGAGQKSVPQRVSAEVGCGIFIEWDSITRRQGGWSSHPKRGRRRDTFCTSLIVYFSSV